jgi:hypothetical protein
MTPSCILVITGMQHDRDHQDARRGPAHTHPGWEHVVNKHPYKESALRTGVGDTTRCGRSFAGSTQVGWLPTSNDAAARQGPCLSYYPPPQKNTPPHTHTTQRSTLTTTATIPHTQWPCPQNIAASQKGQRACMWLSWKVDHWTPAATFWAHNRLHPRSRCATHSAASCRRQ